MLRNLRRYQYIRTRIVILRRPLSEIKRSDKDRWPRNIPVDIKSDGIFKVWIWMLDHIISIFRHRICVILWPEWSQLSWRSWMKVRNGWPEMCGCPVIFKGHTTKISFIRHGLDCRVRLKMSGKGWNGIWVRKGRWQCVKESTINKILMMGVSKPLSNGR